MAGTSGQTAGCVSPQVLRGNAAYRKCSISKMFNNSDVRFRFALGNYIKLVQHDLGRPQSAGYTESTLSDGSYKCYRNVPVGFEALLIKAEKV